MWKKQRFFLQYTIILGRIWYINTVHHILYSHYGFLEKEEIGGRKGTFAL